MEFRTMNPAAVAAAVFGLTIYLLALIFWICL
jgi:hypothetical protein